MHAPNPIVITRSDSIVCFRITERRLMEWDSIRKVEKSLSDPLLAGRLEQESPEMVVIDLSQVVRCSKEFINVLLHTQRHLSSRGCQMVICGLTPHVAESFQVLKLPGNVFQVFPTLEAVLQECPHLFACAKTGKSGV